MKKKQTLQLTQSSADGNRTGVTDYEKTKKKTKKGGKEKERYITGGWIEVGQEERLRDRHAERWEG